MTRTAEANALPKRLPSAIILLGICCLFVIYTVYLEVLASSPASRSKALSMEQKKILMMHVENKQNGTWNVGISRDGKGGGWKGVGRDLITVLQNRSWNMGISRDGQKGGWKGVGGDLVHVLQKGLSPGAVVEVQPAAGQSQSGVRGGGAGAIAIERLNDMWKQHVRSVKQAHAREGAKCLRKPGRVRAFNLEHPLGGSLNGTVSRERLVLPVPPSELIAAYEGPSGSSGGGGPLMQHYTEASGKNGTSWADASAQTWVRHLPLSGPRGLFHGSRKVAVPSPYASFVRLAQEGRAVEGLRMLDTKDLQRLWPGVLVLRNARFGAAMSVSSCDTDWYGGCWMKSHKRALTILQGHAECENGKVPRHDQVIHLTTVKSYHYFYHFMTELFSRFALVAQLIASHPEMKIAGIYPPPGTVWGLGDGNMEALLNFTQDRMIHNEGCANVLYIPETVRCAGLDLNMAHITRAFIKRVLLNAYNPAPLRPTGVSAGVQGWAGAYVVLLMREKGTARAIENHDEVVNALQRAMGGPEGVQLHGGLKLLDQMAYVEGAKGLVGSHGAGFSLMLAMRPGSAIVEYLPTLWPVYGAKTDTFDTAANLCYLRLAAMLGLEYRALMVDGGRFDKPLQVNATAGAEALLSAIQEGHIGDRGKGIS